MTLPVKECFLKAASWEPIPVPKTGFSIKFSFAMCRLLYRTKLELFVFKILKSLSIQSPNAESTLVLNS